MDQRVVPRRTLLRGGAAAGVSGLTMVTLAGPTRAFAGVSENTVVLPWIDQPDPIPPPAADVVGHPLQWESLDSWITPNEEFFTVKHYNQPELAPPDWSLTVDGLVTSPQRLSLTDLQSMPSAAVDFTLECSGNTGLPFFIGGVGNARWAGTPLRRLLKQAQPLGSEVVFWGADRGQVTIRDNSGVTSGGDTGSLEPGTSALTITEQFAHSMSLEDAMKADNLLCYEMNGEPLPAEHGSPLRLIAPGWYGVANVKWLTRIEIRDGRYEGRFMARDYVTIREEERDGEAVWTFTSVSHDRLKSAPAKVLRRGDRYTIMGAAWGAPIAKVEVSVDGGSWQTARLARLTHASSRRGHDFAWRFWTLDWGTPASGEHRITTRATDEDGNVQPPPDDPYLASRRTYWESNGQITRRVQIS